MRSPILLRRGNFGYPSQRASQWGRSALQSSFKPAATCTAKSSSTSSRRQVWDGSDPRRVRGLWTVLSDPNHKSWNIVGGQSARGDAALRVLWVISPVFTK